MNHGSLFSGIGGFDLAAQWMGWNNVFHCEIDEFPAKVLRYYWPDAAHFSDITKTNFTPYNGKIDIISGGFPCQPYSSAGKRLGKEDSRHLWPEMLRAIREIRPRWVVGENVRGLISWDAGLVFDEVIADLANEGYETFPVVLPAASVNAPHRRERIFFIAHCNLPGRGQGDEKHEVGFSKQPDGDHIFGAGPDAERDGLQRRLHPGQRETAKGQTIQFHPPAESDAFKVFPSQSPVCGRNDGFPGELDGITFSKWRNGSIKGYGNAVVPPLILQIFRAIENYEMIYG